jgi:hypothetical protein
MGTTGATGGGRGVQTVEDDGESLRIIMDFDEEARKEAGENYVGRWSGSGCKQARVVCDPTRETGYYSESKSRKFFFDLKTGKLLGQVAFPRPADDIAFDKRGYRHSFGILDTNGNLIMHLGKYGNFDSGNGAESRIPVGGDNIAMNWPRFISGTDNYLCFYDFGERLAVLRLEYEAEETAGVRRN